MAVVHAAASETGCEFSQKTAILCGNLSCGTHNVGMA